MVENVSKEISVNVLKDGEDHDATSQVSNPRGIYGKESDRIPV